MGTPRKSGSCADARLRKMGGALGAAAVLVGLAVLLPKAPFAADPSDVRVVRPDLPALADYLLVVIAFLVAVTAILIRLRIVGRVTRSAPVRRPLWMQLVTLLVFFLVLGTVTERLRDQGLFDRGRQAQGEEERPPADLEQAGVEASSSRSLGLLITGLYLVVMGVLVFGIFLMLRRDEVRPLEEGPVTAFREALERGRRHLQKSDDPRAVVIDTYLAMEAALVSAGAPRALSDTPHEFISRALSDLDISEEDARQLTEIFERARFSAHETTEGMRDDALAAFARVASGLSEEKMP